MLGRAVLSTRRGEEGYILHASELPGWKSRNPQKGFFAFPEKSDYDHQVMFEHRGSPLFLDTIPFYVHLCGPSLVALDFSFNYGVAVVLIQKTQRM